MKDPLEHVALTLLKELGEDPTREGLLKTPQRFAKAMRELTSGYARTPRDVIGEGVFSSESSDPVIVARMKFYSICEHHLLPFFGKCSVAYVPRGKIIGLSKIPRVVDIFSQRFQVQEHLTQQIGDAIEDSISPAGVAVVMSATHLCSVMRNLQDHDAPMITGYRRGVYRDDNALFESFKRTALSEGAGNE
jgi:GTP cyclohydrolase I